MITSSSNFRTSSHIRYLLQVARVDVLVAERVETLLSTEEEGMYAEQQRKVLEQLYREQFPENKATPGLAEIRAEFTTTSPASDSSAAAPTFDELAYVRAIRERLVSAQVVSDAELDDLGIERATNVAAAIVAADPSLADRVIPAEIVDAEATAEGSVRMPLAVTAQQEMDAGPES